MAQLDFRPIAVVVRWHEVATCGGTRLSGSIGVKVPHCGTLTMIEDEWDTFSWALEESLGDRVRLEDQGRGDGAGQGAPPGGELRF